MGYRPSRNAIGIAEIPPYMAYKSCTRPDYIRPLDEQIMSNPLDKIQIISIPTKDENIMQKIPIKKEESKIESFSHQGIDLFFPVDKKKIVLSFQSGSARKILEQLKSMTPTPMVVAWFKLLIQLGAEIRLLLWDISDPGHSAALYEYYYQFIAPFLTHLRTNKRYVVLSNGDTGYISDFDLSYENEKIQITTNKQIEKQVKFCEIVRVV